MQVCTNMYIFSQACSFVLYVQLISITIALTQPTIECMLILLGITSHSTATDMQFIAAFTQMMD